MTDMHDTPTKQCRKCKEIFPATLEYFHKHPTTKDRLNTLCKSCASTKAKEWAQKNSERVKATKYQYHIDHADHIRAKVRKWIADNPERVKEHNREYYQANKEYIDEQNRQWAAANPDKAKAIKRAYVDRDPERRRLQTLAWYYRHPEQAKELRRKYLAEHPEINKKHKAIRRARIVSAPGSFTDADLRALYEEQNGLCGYCGIRLTWSIPGDIHADHVIPLARGGTNYPSNLVLSCKDCNLSKGSKTPSEWEAVRGW